MHPNTSRISNRVLLIGWDAADWKVITPLMEAGKMPNLQHMVETGVKGNIATLQPVLSPMLWTSIATGKRPYKHGIYGFYEPTPDGLNVQPMTNLSRKTKAVWNILNQNGLRSNVIGWWPSHPAEPINGVMVSDLYHKNHLLNGKSKKVPDNTIHPESFVETLEEIRFGAEEFSLKDLLPFIPRAGEVDQEKDHRLAVFAKTLAEAITIQSATTELMENTEWDFTAAYFDAIDHFSHMFMKYHPPRRNHINERDYEIYKDVINGAYIFHDMMLGRLLQLAGPETTVLLVSDHGFHPDELRPQEIPFEPAGPAIEHRDLGVFVACGPGIAKDKLVFGATLLDVTPTILTLFGLPVGEDMDGRVLQDAFDVKPEMQSIESWDSVDGQCGSHPAGMTLSPLDSKKFLQQLVDLGYIDELSKDQQANVDSAVTELNFNLSRSYMDSGRYADAVPILSRLYNANPNEYRFGFPLATCYKSLNFLPELEELIEFMSARRINDAEESRDKLTEMNKLAASRAEEWQEQRRKHHEAHPDLEYDPEKKPTVMDLLSMPEKKEYYRLRSIANVRPYYLDFLRGYSLCARGKNDEAVVCLQRALEAEPKKTSLHIQIGEAWLNLNKIAEAKAAFDSALSIDPTMTGALLGLAKVHLVNKEFAQAAERTQESIGILYHQPMAHYLRGIAFSRLGHHEKGMESLQKATEQNPNFPEAYRLMADISKMKLKNMEMAEEYDHLYRLANDVAAQQLAERGQLIDEKQLATVEPVVERNEGVAVVLLPTLRQSERSTTFKTPSEMEPNESIIVVTGLPRSGTSLMMQMLQAAGLPIKHDDMRQPDEDNPKGYLELEETKSLLKDNTWVPDAKGQVIKVVAPLLEALPSGIDYKVIFMHRELKEVVASQKQMLLRNGQKSADVSDERLLAALTYQLETAARMLHEKGVATIRIPYRVAIDDPANVAKRVTEFLALDLPVDEMAAVVDDSLYRNRVDQQETMSVHTTGIKK